LGLNVWELCLTDVVCLRWSGSEGGWVCWWECDRGCRPIDHHRHTPETLKNAQKRGPEKRARGPPGRGVLRFWVGGIQESRSFLDQKRPKNQKIDRLRGWCNTTPSSV